MDTTSSRPDHDQALASAFDGQADQFEKSPVQTDPQALARLVAFADLAPGSVILDAGCGPGLVGEAFLEAGHSVLGVDLSAEMVRKARRRFERFGTRAWARQGSLYDDNPDFSNGFDASVSRYVLHHVAEPERFLRRQVDLLRPGGSLILCDHTTDPAPERAQWHQKLERLRDRTHTRNLSPGAVVDLFARVGLGQIRISEEAFALDFDEWFDRGTPTASKEEVRRLLLENPGCRGFGVQTRDDGGISMQCWRLLARGTRT